MESSLSPPPCRSSYSNLHRNEFKPTILKCNVLNLFKSCSPHRRCSNVSDLFFRDSIVQSPHNFLYLHCVIQSRDLKKILVGTYSIHWGFYGVEDILFFKAMWVYVLVNLVLRGTKTRNWVLFIYKEENLWENYYLISGNVVLLGNLVNRISE